MGTKGIALRASKSQQIANKPNKLKVATGFGIRNSTLLKKHQHSARANTTKVLTWTMNPFI